MNQRSAYMYALSAVFLWSTVATAFKLTLEYLSPSELLAISTCTSLVVLAVLLSFQKKWHMFSALPKRYVWSMLGLGAMNPFLYYLVLFEAYRLLPAQEAQALNYTWALTLTYLSVFILKQKLRPRDILAGLVCYGGVLVIATRGDVFGLSFSNLPGVFLALGSTLLWALYWIYASKWHQYDPLPGLFLNFLSGVVLIAVFMWWQGYVWEISWKGTLGAVYVGVFEMGVTFFLWLQAMRKAARTATIANLIFLSPFLSLIFISIVLKESILPSTLLGLGMIVGGLLLQKLEKRKNKCVG